ncbi:hypothetical protein DB30_04251 [Enhygromyxa salina]|uniref:Uncharacterized protein n=1 Tax=Enhygromyxa salina TaxID=215803 RepID=A0A0C2D9F8_9BACT|nr:hypothetical protein DB30_04251 [Enhygromyxa salina]
MFGVRRGGWRHRWLRLSANLLLERVHAREQLLDLRIDSFEPPLDRWIIVR